MGKYRTSPNTKKCGECLRSVFFWGLFFFVSPSVVAFSSERTFVTSREVENGSLLLNDDWSTQPSCTPVSANEFPGDLFTKEERLSGAVVIHFLVSFYCFYALFIVCDDFFVPAIEAITRDLGISTDLSGATFMAISTSAPELFTNVIGTFVTKGDLGVGTIVGSAVFNILAVGCCCGLGAGFALHKVHKQGKRPSIRVEWWPLTRDCLFYLCSVGLLLLVLANRRIYWYEALTLLLFYFVYILVMCNNALFKNWAEGLLRRLSSKKQNLTIETVGEKSPLLQTKVKDYFSTPVMQEDPSIEEPSTEEDEVLLKKVLLRSESRCQEERVGRGLCSFPVSRGFGQWFSCLLSFPIRLLFWLSIPDCRVPKWRRWYALTLLMCVCWIAALTYLVSWMMSVIGETLDIPESVTGLTFLAAGTSIPEVISSVIVARQGFGSMGLSNSIGSNTFDLLFCLGVPWLVESLLLAGTDQPYVEIHSGGLEISVLLLVASLIFFYVSIAMNGFQLDWRVGIFCLVMYAVFLPLACLLELNFFFPVNPPPC